MSVRGPLLDESIETIEIPEEAMESLITALEDLAHEEDVVPKAEAMTPVTEGTMSLELKVPSLGVSRRKISRSSDLNSR